MRRLILSKKNEIDWSLYRGFFILDINGNLYTKEEWNPSNNSIANGVAILTDECLFVLSLHDQNTQCRWCYNTSVSIPNLPTSMNTSQLVNNYDGINNTKIIIDYVQDDRIAAALCYAYIFPNGNRGYFGSFGEWEIIRANRDLVQDLLATCDADPLPNYIWCGCMYSTGVAWSMYMDRWVAVAVNYSRGARAFCTLNKLTYE